MEEKKLLKEYSQLHKQLKKYSYIRHIYELSDSETSAMIIGIILRAPFIAIGALFIAIGGFFGIAVIIWVICLVFAQATGRGK